jgi:hypothetical protein
MEPRLNFWNIIPNEKEAGGEGISVPSSRYINAEIETKS